MPAAASPLRGDERLFTYRQRFHFLRQLFAREITSGRVVLSCLEKKLPQPNYTVNTLEALSKICLQKPVLVIGADQAQNLPRWHKADELIKNHDFLIFARRGANVITNSGLSAEVVADFDENISATELRNELSTMSPAERLRKMQHLSES